MQLQLTDLNIIQMEHARKCVSVAVEDIKIAFRYHKLPIYKDKGFINPGVCGKCRCNTYHVLYLPPR